MILDIQDDAPPTDQEIYIVVIKKAFIEKTRSEGTTIWCPFQEDFPIGYVLPTDDVVTQMRYRHGERRND